MTLESGAVRRLATVTVTASLPVSATVCDTTAKCHSADSDSDSQTPKSPNPAPSRPDLAGTILSRDFPDPDLSGIGKTFGI